MSSATMSSVTEAQPVRKTDADVPSQQPEEETASPDIEKQNVQAEGNNDEQRAEDDTAEDDPKNDEERAGRTLFVGNVPKGTDRKRILKLFKPFGTVETVRLRNIVPSNPNIGRRKAFLSKQLSPHVDSISAYVVFAAAEKVDDIIEKACKGVNMTILDEKHLRVSRASDNGASSKRHSAFVGNLPFDCQEEELIQTFLPVAEKVGAKLLNVRVNRDKETGVCRGVGFVSFDDEVAVQACINQSGDLKLRKNRLRVSKATKQENKNSKTFKRARRGHAQNNRLSAKKQAFKPKRKEKGGKKS